MKKVILLMTALFSSYNGIAQVEFPYDEMMQCLDTVLVVPANSPRINIDSEGSLYILTLYEDQSIYELSMVYSGTEIILISSISWGNYIVRRNNMHFQDKVAGFIMTASIESDGFRFNKDYFPDIDKFLWTYAGHEQSDDEILSRFYATYDHEKAKLCRKLYQQKHPELLEFNMGVYEGHFTLEIADQFKWSLTNHGMEIAEGTWHRNQNNLVLKCPKLRSKFFMVITADGLRSMLLLGDRYGSYYSLVESW